MFCLIFSPFFNFSLPFPYVSGQFEILNWTLDWNNGSTFSLPCASQSCFQKSYLWLFARHAYVHQLNHMKSKNFHFKVQNKRNMSRERKLNKGRNIDEPREVEKENKKQGGRMSRLDRLELYRKEKLAAQEKLRKKASIFCATQPKASPQNSKISASVCVKLPKNRRNKTLRMSHSW